MIKVRDSEGTELNVSKSYGVLSIDDGDNFVNIDEESSTRLAYAILKQTRNIHESTNELTSFVTPDMTDPQVSELARTLCDGEFPSHPEDREAYYSMARKAIDNGWFKIVK